MNTFQTTNTEDVCLTSNPYPELTSAIKDLTQEIYDLKCELRMQREHAEQCCSECGKCDGGCQE